MVTIESAVSKTGNALQLRESTKVFAKKDLQPFLASEGHNRMKICTGNLKINLLESQEFLVSLESSKNPKNLWYLW